MTETEIKVVGLSFRHVTTKLKRGDRVKLVPEPTNEYDPNALAVMTLDGEHIGYVGKKDPLRLRILSKAKKEDVTLPVLIANYYEEGKEKLWPSVGEGDMVQLWLRAFSRTPLEDTTFVPLTSFTGEEVLWSEYLHICTDMQGNELLGGSTYASQFEPEFDTDRVAKAYAKKNNLEEQDVKDYWKSLARLSTDTGTAIHGALEHYSKHFRTFGHDMALPRQKALREAVEAFLMVSDFTNCKAEPLVTDIDRGMSGWIDNLRFHGDKRVTIEDYKTNTFNSHDDYAKKWPAKLDYYQNQLNYYGTILENHGYTVDGLVVWHWYRDEWKRHPMQFKRVEEYAR